MSCIEENSSHAVLETLEAFDIHMSYNMVEVPSKMCGTCWADGDVKRRPTSLE